MFTNTVKLVGADSVVRETALIDGPTNRRTLRATADGRVRLSLAHQESNENPGFTNQRSNVRVEQDFVLDDTDKTVKAYVQLTLSYPKDQVTSLQLAELVGMLVNFLHHGENAAASDSVDQDLMRPLVARLFAGEP
jgi:hypothetical protein